MTSKSVAGDLAPGERQDFPVVIANSPATVAERRLAYALIILLVAVFMAVTPFAGTRLVRVDAFIPVLQTVLCVAELITAILLFAQYSVRPQYGLLALASGYIFSGLFAFLQTFAFPGAYAPGGLIGDALSSAPYLFCLWHVAFPMAVVVYAFSKDSAEDATRGKSARLTIGITVASVLAMTAALTWMVTSGVKYLPSLFVDTTRQAPITSYLTGSIWLLSATALVLLFVYKRTSLATWLMVTLVATLPDLALSTVMTSVRFTLGWYTARTYALIASFAVLAVILTETTLLYARLANAILLLRRERSNRLMSIDAATSAMAHEIRQPLTAIAATSKAASLYLERSPPNLAEVRECLDSISEASNQAEKTISGVRELFNRDTARRKMININDVVRQAVKLARPELLHNDVTVIAELHNDLPDVYADPILMQQVILNLVRNAIDAMSATRARKRDLRLRTNVNRDASVLLSIQDTGPGIAAEESKRVFDAFYTTKLTGMGLGLSICQTIVQDHGGNLRLAKSDMNGCTFEIALPIAAIGRGDADRRH